METTEGFNLNPTTKLHAHHTEEGSDHSASWGAAKPGIPVGKGSAAAADEKTGGGTPEKAAAEGL